MEDWLFDWPDVETGSWNLETLTRHLWQEYAIDLDKVQAITLSYNAAKTFKYSQFPWPVPIYFSPRIHASGIRVLFRD